MTKNFSNFLAEALAASRSRTSWNERLAHWERPASDSEERIIARAATMVRDALWQRPWLTEENVEVRPQGSYHNNTNVRLESDMDLCVLHPGLMVKVADDVSHDRAHHALGYSYTGAKNPDIADDLRSEIGAALIDAFGEENVDAGRKAFTVSGIPGSRADADAVPALRMHYIVQTTPSLVYPSGLRAIEGVVIYGTDGSQTYNFPEQHTANGRTKRANTQHRFKKNVRSLKRLRDELVEQELLAPGQVSSFLIECLTYNVEDRHFLFEEDDRYDRGRRILWRMREQLADADYVFSAREINGWKFLFRSTQPWTAQDARAFVDAALARLNGVA